MPDLDAFFRRYAEAFNRALAGELAFDDIMAAFAESFVGAGPGGVNAGQNGDEFRKVLEQGYAFYRQIGTKRMSVRSVETTPIDAAHHMAKVFWRADYEKDSKPITIDFDVTYLLQDRGGSLKIFAFIAGDEMGLYRQYGLVD